MKIYVWGTGAGAEDLLEEELKDIDIEAFIDNAEKEEFMSKHVYRPKDMVGMDYEAIIVASGYAKEIYDQAQYLGLDLSKFIFIYNNYFFNDMNSNYDLALKIFSSSFIDIVKSRYRVIRGMQIDEISLLGGAEAYEYDYNRIRTLELLSREIQGGGIIGSVAELCVFRGKFAKCINGFFSDRTCYLFDSFEGFRMSEAIKEKRLGHCGDALIERFKNNSEKEVLSIMPHPNKVICKKGLFPESLEGLEDKFAFVSLDVDFEQSIYDGLDYFYPRLNRGGYIMVHDYNSKSLEGVRNAVHRYEQKTNVFLPKVPIPDISGTLVVTKL